MEVVLSWSWDKVLNSDVYYLVPGIQGFSTANYAGVVLQSTSMLQSGYPITLDFLYVLE